VQVATVLQADKRFIGRRQELAALDQALDGIKVSRPRWLVVSGEPGIGKTRLLSELAERAAARHHPVFVGRGAELESDMPFAIWIDALDDHVASLGERRLEALIGERVGELARVLPSAAPAGAGDGGLQDERFHAYRAVRALLQRMAMGTPVVLILDDVHWADDASLELIAHLLRRPPPAAVLIALAFRAGQVPNSLLAALEAAGRDGLVTGVELGPLTQAEADALLGGPQPALYRQSGGNPFYLEELARHGAPAGGEDADVVGVPPAVAAALGQEITGLGDAARQLAWGGAVAGEPFDLDLAAAAAGLGEANALAAIDHLLAARVAVPTAVPRRYRFRHPLVRRAVYDGAGEAWRLQAHARAAEALAVRPGALAARAHHVEQSARVGDDAAAAVLEQAAHQAAARAPAIAARWFEAALRLLGSESGDDPFRRLGLLVPLAGALAATGRLEKALDTLVDALPLVEMADLRVRLIAACAACENLLGRHDAAHARLLAALDALEDRHGAAAAALHAELAADALYDSDFEAMRSWAARAVDTARALGDRGLEALATALLCFAEYNLGHAVEAATVCDKSAALLDALPDDQLAMRIDAAYYLGFAEYFCERYDDSIRHLRRGINVSRASGQGQFVVPMQLGLAHGLEVRGRLAEAAETADAALEAARLAGNRQLIGWALVSDAWMAAAAGDVDHARSSGEEAIALLDVLDDSVLTRATHAHLGVMWIDIGEIDRGLTSFRAVGMPDFPSIEPGRRGWIYAILARAELARGDRAAAEMYAARAEEVLEGLGLPFAEAWLLHSRAAIALAGGDAAGAAELALEGAARAAAVDAPLPAARCRTLAGEALAAAGRRDDGVRELQRAEAELSALGAVRHRDEAARELRRLGERVTARQRRGGGEGLDALSGREREIAELVAEGRTNREIGGELFLSEKTVEGHLTRVFGKLGVTSRAEVAEVVGRARAAP
jgi:DNA-binding CsgD family transcriptional regulator/tetratricopeptide (TPR) repeat protein